MEKGSHSNLYWPQIKCVAQIGLQLLSSLLKLSYLTHLGVLISFQKENKNSVEGCEVCLCGFETLHKLSYKVEHMGPACAKVES